MCDREGVDSKESAGAPDEIEVTPAMIEAGIEALGGFDPEYEIIREAAIRIYRSMEIAKRRRTSSDQRNAEFATSI
jgi:hypothetical protein